MANPELTTAEHRAKVLDAVEALWELYPRERLCQLLSNSAFAAGWGDNDLFNLEDPKLLEGIRDRRSTRG